MLWLKLLLKRQPVPEGEPWGDAPATGGRNIPVRKSQEDIKTELSEARDKTAVSAGMMASATPVGRKGSVTIVGKSNGDVPAWLIRNAEKAGVTKVYDNRDTATKENKRPMFVSADDQRVPFWAPKTPTASDVGLKF